MTRQYPLLKYITHFVIFVFHITILFLLYHYSTKSKQNLLVQNHAKSETIDSVKKDEISLVKPKETIISFQNEPITEQVIEEKLFDNILNTLSDNPAKEVEIKEEKTSSTILEPKSLIEDKSIKPLYTTRPFSDSPDKSEISRPFVSPAAFFQAFKDSYYQEQKSLGNLETINNLANTSNNSESESLVNERLGELKITDYVMQIKKAFQEAAKRTPGMYLNSGKELKTDIDVKLEIQKVGEVKIVKFQSSGIDQIDDYIKKFLQDIIVGPIPKRYKIEALPFSTKILINVDRSTRFYTIRCFF